MVHRQGDPHLRARVSQVAHTKVKMNDDSGNIACLYIGYGERIAKHFGQLGTHLLSDAPGENAGCILSQRVPLRPAIFPTLRTP